MVSSEPRRYHACTRGWTGVSSARGNNPRGVGMGHRASSTRRELAGGSASRIGAHPAHALVHADGVILLCGNRDPVVAASPQTFSGQGLDSILWHSGSSYFFAPARSVLVAGSEPATNGL